MTLNLSRTPTQSFDGHQRVRSLSSVARTLWPACRGALSFRRSAEDEEEEQGEEEGEEEEEEEVSRSLTAIKPASAFACFKEV